MQKVWKSWRNVNGKEYRVRVAGSCLLDTEGVYHLKPNGRMYGAIYICDVQEDLDFENF